MTQAELNAFYSEHIYGKNATELANQIAVITGTHPDEVVNSGIVKDFNSAHYGPQVKDGIVKLSMLIRAYNSIVKSSADNVPANAAARIAALEAMGVANNPTAPLAKYSHAEGGGCTASEFYAHAEGFETEATSACAHAEGYRTKATDQHAHAEGNATVAGGDNSHAEGNNTYAAGDNSHAEGYNTSSDGNNSHAEGSGTSAKGNHSHAEGLNTEVDYEATAAHAEGSGTTVGTNAIAAHSEGVNTSALGTGSHAEGLSTSAIGNYSHAEGNDNSAAGFGSHVEGHLTSTETGTYYSHAEGNGTHAARSCQHVQGSFNIPDTSSAFIIGNGSDADHRSNAMTVDFSGNATFAGRVDSTNISRLEAMGVANNPTVSGTNAHAEGNGCTASGNYSHAEGLQTQAAGQGSHTEGNLTSTDAGAYYSHAEGWGTIANGDCQHVMGRYNEPQGDGVAFIIGCGNKNTETDVVTRDNALTVDFGGNAEFKGNVTAKRVEAEAASFGASEAAYANMTWGYILGELYKLVISNNQLVYLPMATQKEAQKLYITGSDNKLYEGVLKCVNGKPVYVYDEFVPTQIHVMPE